MRIKVINPNTSDSMTKSIADAAHAAAGKGTEILCVSNPIGPESIECYTDEYLSIPGIIKEILKGDKEEGIDAYIIACFCDPGLQAAREVTAKPVLGIGQSSLLAARMLAPNFSVVSVLDRSKKATLDMLKENGLYEFCCSIRSTGMGVLEFGQYPEKGLKALTEEARKAIEQDGAECILLGCAGFVEFAEKMQAEFGVPVLEGIIPAVKFAEGLVSMGVNTSKISTWSRPEPKEFTGYSFPLVFS